ncbi:unnamed protein product [Rotaria sordida]|uniref:TTF-type domain-containing protein n=1 Tax=Rotaria sordida TaxID=392033 RepID=A0A815R8E1_9BILA|nr:unnamed protein product [Rotaria sordida]
MSSKRSPSILEYFSKKTKGQESSLSTEDSKKQMTENYDQSSNQLRLDKSEKPSTTDNSIPPLTSATNNSLLLLPTTKKNNTISLSTISTTIDSTSSLEPTTNSSTSSSRAVTNSLTLLSPITRKNNSSSLSPELTTNSSTSSSRATTNNLTLLSPTTRKNHSSSSSPEPTINSSTSSSRATTNNLTLLSPTTRKNNSSSLLPEPTTNSSTSSSRATTNNLTLLSPTTRKNNSSSLSPEPTTNSSISSSQATINDLILLSPTTRKNNSSSLSLEPTTNSSTSSSRATTNNLTLLSPTTRKNNSSSLSLEPTTNSSTSSSQATTNDLILLSPTTRKNNLSSLSITSVKNNSVFVSPITNSVDQTMIDISKCDLNCCSSSKAYHPLKEDELVSATINKRSCQKKWFTDYPWLTFCKTKRRVFCCACREAFEREIHPTKTKLFPHHVTFIVNGYCDWKNAISRFKLHEKTKLHLDSIYVVNQQMKPNIAIQLTSATKKQQEQRRQSLSIQISCIIYLLRQGLALRGHDDENSNLIQLLKLRSADNEYLNEWIKNRKYFSHDIVNEICKEIYLTIIRDIVKEISSRKWFSLICDETCDESTTEQLCITIRSVNSNYKIFEDVIGLYEISAQNAPTIVEAIYDVITRCGLDMINCRGQSYDGASNMSGIYGDLAVHDLTDQCASICNCMLCVKDIIDFIRRSPKRLVILKEIFNQISSSYTNLTALCPHRWTMRAESYGSLLKTYEQVQEALYPISKEKGGPGIKANGNLVFTDTEKLSRAFQSSDCYLQDVFCAAEAIIYRFRRIQDDINFELFYNQVVKDSEGLTEKPILPRLRRPPGRYESNTILVNHASCEDFYQKQYVETLEMIINMLQTRFTQKNFKMLCEVENFILNISNKPPDLSIDYIKTIIDFCYDDIDIERLKSEAVMISDFFKVVINTNQMKIKRITKISTVCEILNICEIGKQMFREFDKLIRLYLTIPVTTATSERAFSVLNRVKSTLRSTMTQSRLNHLLLAHIYKEKLDEIDPNQIMSTFISSNEQRQAFFGLML